MRRYVLTLNGTAQQLSSVLAADNQLNRRPFRQIAFSARAANSNPIFIGGPDTVSATDYGFRVNTPVMSVPDAPIIWGAYDSGPIKLEEIFVIGTDAEILHIAAEEF